MTTVQVKSNISIEINELIGGVSKLDTIEIEDLLAEISVLLAQRKAPSIPVTESDLLRRIGKGLPDDIQHRYDELQTKLLAEKISTREHQELLGLIEIVENADAERLQSLIKLSQLRRITLDELMTQLGIHHPPVYA
jgi:hypothetical protein